MYLVQRQRFNNYAKQLCKDVMASPYLFFIVAFIMFCCCLGPGLFGSKIMGRGNVLLCLATWDLCYTICFMSSDPMDVSRRTDEHHMRLALYLGLNILALFIYAICPVIISIWG